MTNTEREGLVRMHASALNCSVLFSTELRAAYASLDFIKLHVSFVAVPRQQDSKGYWVALHELGHAATVSDYPMTMAEHSFRTTECLECEAAAWEWALDNSTIPPNKTAWKVAFASLRSYNEASRAPRGPLFRRIYETAQIESGGELAW